MGAPLAAITRAVKNLLEANKGFLQHKETLYGIQTLIKSLPTICVTGEKVTQDLNGSSQYEHRVLLRLVVFFGRFEDGGQEDDNNYLQAMEFGEKLQDFFNERRYAIKDTDGNQLLLFFSPTSYELGIAVKENVQTKYRTVSMTLEGFTHEIMPTPVET